MLPSVVEPLLTSTAGLWAGLYTGPAGALGPAGLKRRGWVLFGTNGQERGARSALAAECRRGSDAYGPPATERPAGERTAGPENADIAALVRAEALT